MKAPLLESERLTYVPVSLKHLSEDYVAWLNDPDVYKFLETRGNYTSDKLKQFLEGCESNPNLFWAIHIKTNNLHIGNIKIDPVNLVHGTAEYAIMMGRKTEWGKGYACEASARVIDFCFKDIGLRKITLGVIADNVAAIHLYKKLKFNIEGLYKNHVLHDGKYHDVIRMALFNKNFIYEK